VRAADVLRVSGAQNGAVGKGSGVSGELPDGPRQPGRDSTRWTCAQQATKISCRPISSRRPAFAYCQGISFAPQDRVLPHCPAQLVWREIQTRCVAASLPHRPPHALIAGNAPGRWVIRALAAVHGHAAGAARGCSAHAATRPSLAPAGHSLWQRQEQQQPPCRAGSPSQRCSSCRWPGRQQQQVGGAGRLAAGPAASRSRTPRVCQLRPLGPALHCHHALQRNAVLCLFLVYTGRTSGQFRGQHLTSQVPALPACPPLPCSALLQAP
jgi:hypothetical protein